MALHRLAFSLPRAAVRPASSFSLHQRVATRALHVSRPCLNGSTIPMSITGIGRGAAQNISIAGSAHKFTADAYTSFGGADSAPTPLAYQLGALASCTQVTGSLVARDHGITLGEWKVSVNAQLDPSVLVRGVEGNANWKSMELVVEVETDADEKGFERFKNETERRCPISQTVIRSGLEWKNVWTNKRLSK